MNERAVFRVWVAASVLLPWFVALAIGAIASSDPAFWLMCVGTACEGAGLGLAAYQINDLGKHWGFEGFWSMWRPVKKVTASLSGSSQGGGHTSGSLTSIVDRTNWDVVQRLDYLERCMEALQNDFGRQQKQIQENKRELVREIREVRESTEKAHRELADKVKAPAVTNLGPGFAAIFVTLSGMLIANFATQIAGWFS